MLRRISIKECRSGRSDQRDPIRQALSGLPRTRRCRRATARLSQSPFAQREPRESLAKDDCRSDGGHAALRRFHGEVTGVLPTAFDAGHRCKTGALPKTKEPRPRGMRRRGKENVNGTRKSLAEAESARGRAGGCRSARRRASSASLRTHHRTEQPEQPERPERRKQRERRPQSCSCRGNQAAARRRWRPAHAAEGFR